MPVPTEPTIRMSDTYVRLVCQPTGVFPVVYFDAPPADERYEVGVQIADHRSGLGYVVTVDAKARALTSRFDSALPAAGPMEIVHTPDGKRAASARMLVRPLTDAARMSDAELAARACAFLDRRSRWIARQPLPKADQQRLVAVGQLRYGENEDRESAPTLATFANEALLARGAGVPLARWFSHDGGHPWQMAPRTVARWTERARDAGLLSEKDFPRKQGRPRKTDATTEEG